jgi:methylated-DNA-[protein]-cysteine S-methyltransferase
MEQLYQRTLKSPVGTITVCCSDRGVRSVSLSANDKTNRRNGASAPLGRAKMRGEQLAQQAAQELTEYLAGRRTEFTVPLDLQGTAFQKQVWKALLEIPYGETRSYGEIARRVGRPGAARAVGMANHYNPAGIIVPCHRVIGSDGSLTGYAGGLNKKSKLLRLEQQKRQPRKTES